MADHGLPPGVPDTSVPPQYRDHPLIKRRFFYTLPSRLLTAISAKVGQDRFNRDLLKMDSALSKICSDHSQQVGFWDGRALTSPWLRNSSLNEAAANHIREITNSDDPEAVIELADRRLNRFKDVLRGYNGWLLTNPCFLNEHNELLRRWRAEIEEYGLPHPVQSVSLESTPLDAWRRVDSCDAPYAVAMRDFCMRWRLSQLSGPFLPDPLAPQFPASLATFWAKQAANCGALIYIPDTFPLYSGNDVMQMIEDAVRDFRPPEHLAAWIEVVSSGNTGKRKIIRFGRLFEIQHYFRMLYSRHTEAIYRKQGKLKEALAEFLGVNEDSIDKDVQVLRGHLGGDWYLEPDPLALPNGN